MTTALHNYIKAAFIAQGGLHGTNLNVTCDMTPDETWLVAIYDEANPSNGVAYKYQIGDEGNEDDPMRFVRIGPRDVYWPEHVDIRVPDEVLQEHGSEFANTQGETQASPAWQLLEVANDDLAERLIEHHKMSAEIETITADEIMDLISQMGGKG